jgi:MinD superfamily P-loop ATPase
MKRVFQLIKSFSLKSACCINKYDLNTEKTAEIEAFCADNGIQVIGKIPYDKEVVMSMVQGIPAVVDSDSPASQALKSLPMRGRNPFHFFGQTIARGDFHPPSDFPPVKNLKNPSTF